MSWQERLREAAYTSPGGVRLTFDYESTTEEFDQKGGSFDFADADGTYVQSLGVTGRRYALRLILWGDSHDLQSKSWMSALAESGQGILEHPAYGRVDVVPVGTIKRRDDLVTSANQSVIEVEFFETIGLVYPTSTKDQQAITLELANEASAAQLADSGVTETASFLSEYNSKLNDVSAYLKSITPDPTQFNAIERSINRSIDVLVKQPLTMAFQTQQLIQQPSRALDSAIARLDAYSNLAKSTTVKHGLPVVATNLVSLVVGDLFASGSTVATAQASVNTEYRSRPEAIAAAENLLNLMDDLSDYRDLSYANIEEVDTGTSWQATQQYIAEAAGALIDQSFTLAQQRFVVLASDRSIIDLTYELYGVVDDKLDDLISDNDLSGDEIIELPRGKEIVYYAA